MNELPADAWQYIVSVVFIACGTALVIWGAMVIAFQILKGNDE